MPGLMTPDLSVALCRVAQSISPDTLSSLERPGVSPACLATRSQLYFVDLHLSLISECESVKDSVLGPPLFSIYKHSLGLSFKSPNYFIPSDSHFCIPSPEFTLKRQTPKIGLFHQHFC